MKVPYLWLKEQQEEYREELRGAFERVMDSSYFILGDETKKFEENIAQMLGVKHVIGVNSGTDALFLSMKALDIGPGDEVIVPANSFLASATTVVQTGATPVFADVQDDLLINPNDAKEKITSKTKAIMPVHLTGKSCDMNSILKLAKTFNLFVVEDAAQAILAKYKGVPVGTIGDVGCFSVHPLKNLSACGDGGFITTNNEELYQKLLPLRNIGLKNRDEADIIGYNSRLDSLQAALLNVKLPHLEELTKARQENAKRYKQLFLSEHLDQIITLPEEENNTESVYHTYVIQVPNRDELKIYMEEKGIETKIHYPSPIHKQKAFSNYQAQVPLVEEQSKKILSLPIHEYLKEEEINYVVKTIIDFYRRNKK